VNKTDKELTTEIVCSFLNAWSGPNKTPSTLDEMSDLIQTVYKAVSELGSDSISISKNNSQNA